VAEVGTRLIASNLPPPLLWHSYETQQKVRQMDAIGRLGGADVVFLGPSLMDSGLEPAIVDANLGGGVVAYNAALASSIPRMTEVWAMDVVIPRLHPKVLVLGVDSYDLTDAGAGRTVFYDAFRRSPGAQQAMGTESLTREVDRWLGRHSALWDHRFQLRDPKTAAKAILGRTPAQDPEAATLEPNGRQSFDQNFQFAVRGHGVDVSRWSLGRQDPSATDQLIARARALHISVVLVSMPVTNEFVLKHPHGEADYQTFGVALRALASRDGVVLVDLSQMRDHAYFADEIHLNRNGAQAFSTRISDALRAHHIPG
jgi:hypothetical protein